jgi:hypothetical protein
MNRIASFAVCVFLVTLLSSCSDTNKGDGQMSFLSKLFGKGSAVDTTDYYSIVYKATGVNVTLEVNGKQVMREDYEFGGAGSRPVNEWTKQGANTLTIKLKPLKNSPDDYMKYELLFAKGRKGQMADEGEKLWDFLWESNSSAEKLPLEKTFEFKI